MLEEYGQVFYPYRRPGPGGAQLFRIHAVRARLARPAGPGPSKGKPGRPRTACR